MVASKEQIEKMPRDVLLYVTAYEDHLNEHLPEFAVVSPRQKPGDRPYFRVPDLRERKIPNIIPVTLPDYFKGWEYWRCNWTQSDMERMGYDFEYVLDENYVAQIPDIWFLDGLFVTEEVRDFIEQLAPETSLFFKAKFYSKQTGEQLVLDRWVLHVRNWLLATGRSEMPRGLDFSISDFDAYQYSQIQNVLEIREYLNSLGIFCFGKSMHKPIYSPLIFDALKAEGFSGLTEKIKQNQMLHDFREVITHVYDIHQS